LQVKDSGTALAESVLQLRQTLPVIYQLPDANYNVALYEAAARRCILVPL
jgi:hypothetical protein